MFCSGFGGYGIGAVGSTGFGWMFLMMGFRFLLFIGLVVLAVKFFKGSTNKSNDMLRLLDERFAKGEISEEDYLKRKSVLSQKN